TSSARSRAALSAIIVDLPNAAQRPQSAVVARTRLWIDFRVPRAKILCYALQRYLPLLHLPVKRKRWLDVHLRHRRQFYVARREPSETQLSRANHRESRRRHRPIAGRAIQRQLRFIRPSAFPTSNFELARLVVQNDLPAVGQRVHAIRPRVYFQAPDFDQTLRFNSFHPEIAALLFNLQPFGPQPLQTHPFEIWPDARPQPFRCGLS